MVETLHKLSGSNSGRREGTERRDIELAFRTVLYHDQRRILLQRAEEGRDVFDLIRRETLHARMLRGSGDFF